MKVDSDKLSKAVYKEIVKKRGKDIEKINKIFNEVYGTEVNFFEELTRKIAMSMFDRIKDIIAKEKKE